MKRDLPRYVYARKSRGGVYHYFERGGQRVRVYPDRPDFWTHYAQLLAYRPEARTRHVTRSFAALIDDYQQSQRYGKLARNTRKSYDRYLSWWRDKLGALPVAGIKRRDVIRARDAGAETPTSANRRTAVMVVLLEHSIDIGWRKDNPARGVSQLASKRPRRQPWPRDVVEAFRTAADPRTRLIMELALGTGQRIGDVLAMQWGHIENGEIRVRQQKTRREMWIPIIPSLAAVLADTPKRGLYIVSHDDGRALSYGRAWHYVNEVRKAIGAEAYDIHAWRHTAAAELAEAGCTDEMIQAVTGHSSSAMVALYSGAARQRARAKQAQKRRNGTSTERES